MHSLYKTNLTQIITLNYELSKIKTLNIKLRFYIKIFKRK